MRKRVKFKTGQKVGNWNLTSLLGKGGNGEVWRCRNDNNDERAIKLLKTTNQKRYDRFKDEIYILEKKSKLGGILHPLEKNLPNVITDSIPYYVMVVAQPSFTKLKGKSIVEKVDAILEIADTLNLLHNENISHRDIKPANILYLNKHYYLTDFGLVDYPSKKDISSMMEQIGPKWTIAPEMRRSAYNSDGKKADVYSLSKTLWIILTENLTGFDGQYSINSIIELKKFYRETHTSLIDDLLLKCTDNDPKNRPTVDEFIETLNNWKKLNNSFHLTNQRQWFEIQTQLFPTAIPQRVVWEKRSDIIKTLKIIGSIPNLNHMFFPNGGGMDLYDCRESVEEGCIELDCGYIEIVKPKRMIYESFSYNHDWNYFRLELDELNPSGVYDKEYYQESDYEEVSEISPGVYDDFNLVEFFTDYAESHHLTEYSRHVTRWLKGCFVIFCKRSAYNADSSTYDGRHNKYSTDEFRKYIEENINVFKENEKKLPESEKIKRNEIKKILGN